MAWISQFKLGRPGFESLFDCNPMELTPTWARMSSRQRNLAGDLKERVLRGMTPVVKLKSNWLPKSQLDLLVSMVNITDTFLAFLTRDDWTMSLEPNIAPNTTTVQIQNSSITKLSAIYAAGGYGSTPTQGTITITGVWASLQNVGNVISGAGTNYYTGGSYADATRTITLGTALPQAQQVYVTYTYPGWLCQFNSIDTPITGGLVDLFGYDSFTLTGV